MNKKVIIFMLENGLWYMNIFNKSVMVGVMYCKKLIIDSGIRGVFLVKYSSGIVVVILFLIKRVFRLSDWREKFEDFFIKRKIK